MHIRRSVATVAAALTLTFGSGTAGWAAPGTPSPSGGSATGQAALPTGWKLTERGSDATLTWRAPERVPFGDAMVEFYAGDRPLGRPIPAADQRTFKLDLDGARAQKLTDLQVWASGRRLDVDLNAGKRKARTAPRATAEADTGATALPAAAVDPGTRGTYATTTGEYELDSVKLPELPEPVEMKAVVVAPVGAPSQRPLALFLHGRHSACYVVSDKQLTGGWPCPEGTKPVPSYRGYLQAQKVLASQGYVTVSISANGINAQDGWYARQDGGAQARSSLVRLHLARWADWAGSARPQAPQIVRDAPVVDTSRVFLVGHSRGGEGVARAAVDSLSRPPATQDGYSGQARWQIRGVALIGPTLFGHNPPPDVPSMTILPSCDGDVSDLQGQMYADATRGVSRGTALHSSVYVVGANHNYFNTEWTDGQATADAGDDYWDEDEACRHGSPSRLTYQQQQTVGATYIAAAAQLFVNGDDRVRPLLDGSGVRAPSADPARVLSHAIGGNRAALVVPDPSVTTTGTGIRLCEQVTNADSSCLPDDPNNRESSPHFTPFDSVVPEAGRYAVALDWSQPGNRVAARPAKPVSVAGAEALALRVIVPAASTDTRLEFSVTDANGRRATLGEAELDGLIRKPWTAAAWGQEVRLPVAGISSAGLDASRITALELTPRSASGKAWLVDAWAWRSGTPGPQPTALPRVDFGEATVDEGDSGSRTVQLPITLTGSGDGQFRVFVSDPRTDAFSTRVVTVRQGSNTVDVPVTIEGNTEPGSNQWFVVAAKTIQGVAVGDYIGTLTVRDDDQSE